MTDPGAEAAAPAGPAGGRTAGRAGGGLARRLLLAAAAALLATATAAGLIALGGGAAARPMPIARPFTLVQVGAPGGRVSLADYRGRPLIINFFASWCSPCKRETPLLARYFLAHHGSILVIGVDANDHLADALRFMRAAGVSYPVGFDPSMATTLSYGVTGLPQTFFLNARHRIIRHVFGDVTAAELRSWAAGLPASGTGLAAAGLGGADSAGPAAAGLGDTARGGPG